MPYATFGTPVNASPETVWATLLDKAQNPAKYIPYAVEEFKIHERFENGLLREIKTAQMHMVERVTIDKDAGTVTFDLVDHPLYTGAMINFMSPPPGKGSGGPTTVGYTMDLKPRSEAAEQQPEAGWFKNASRPDMIEKAVLHLKEIIESEKKA